MFDLLPEDLTHFPHRVHTGLAPSPSKYDHTALLFLLLIASYLRTCLLACVLTALLHLPETYDTIVTWRRPMATCHVLWHVTTLSFRFGPL